MRLPEARGLSASWDGKHGSGAVGCARRMSVSWKQFRFGKVRKLCGHNSAPVFNATDLDTEEWLHGRLYIRCILPQCLKSS